MQIGNRSKRIFDILNLFVCHGFPNFHSYTATALPTFGLYCYGSPNFCSYGYGFPTFAAMATSSQILQLHLRVPDFGAMATGPQLLLLQLRLFQLLRLQLRGPNFCCYGYGSPNFAAKSTGPNFRATATGPQLSLLRLSQPFSATATGPQLSLLWLRVPKFCSYSYGSQFQSFSYESLTFAATATGPQILQLGVQA